MLKTAHEETALLSAQIVSRHKIFKGGKESVEDINSAYFDIHRQGPKKVEPLSRLGWTDTDFYV